MKPIFEILNNLFMVNLNTKHLKPCKIEDINLLKDKKNAENRIYYSVLAALTVARSRYINISLSIIF